MYYRRIVCDFDDTIAITKDRSWESAEPNFEVINKINRLFDQGWEILILTARGQISCNGDSSLADLKYRSQIEAYLKKYGVKYHSLSFNKVLATYYIDDKGLTPDQFIQLEVEVIKGGWSGAHVEKRGDKIYKTHHDSLPVSKWYSIAKNFLNVPKVHSLVGDTICLEYIEPTSDFDINNVIEVIQKIKEIGHGSHPFELYEKRISKHLILFDKIGEFDSLFEKFEKYHDLMNNSISFSHGDFSLENIITNNGKLYLIDPIYDEFSYSSYILDIGKMLHSLRKHKKLHLYDFFIKKCSEIFNLDKNLLILVEITQWIRVIKYMNDEKLKKEFISIAKSLLFLCY